MGCFNKIPPHTVFKSIIEPNLDYYPIYRSRKTHPGPVLYLGENPTDPSKVRVGFYFVDCMQDL